MTACDGFVALTMGLLLNLPQLGTAAPPRLDSYGDPLPPDALARIGTGRFRHFASVQSLAYSPDGKLIAGGDSFEGPAESSIVVWEAATGRQLHRMEGHGHVVRALAFAPDSRRLAAACGDGSLRIWDVDAEREIARLETEGASENIVFTSDGERAVAADKDGVGLWDAATGRRLKRFAGPGGAYRMVAVSPDDKRIACCDINGLILLWDRATGKELRRFQIASRYVGYVAFSLDGKRLIYGGDEAICLWDVETGQEVQRIKSPDYRLCSQPFLSAGRVLVTYKDAIRFWDMATAKEIRCLEGRRGYVSALTLSPDGKIMVTASSQETAIRRWDTATGRELSLAPGHNFRVASVCFSPDRKSLATASSEPDFRLWDAASGKLIRTFTAEGREVVDLACSPDGTTLAVSMSHVLGDSGQPVALWDVKTGQRLCLLGEKGQGSRSVAFSAEGDTLAANLSDASVVCWDAAARKPCFHPFKGEVNPLISSFEQYSPFVLAPDGKSMMTVCFLDVRSHLVVWDAFRGKRRFAIATAKGKSASHSEVPADISSDGRRIATLYGEGVRLRESSSGSIVRTFEVQGDVALRAVFSPDSRWLATVGTDRSIRIWNLATGRQQQILRGHRDAIRCLAFAPDGQHLASGSDDMTALIWCIKENRPVEAVRPRLTARKLESLWRKLADKDAVAAEQAVWDFVLAADAGVAFLRERLAPVSPVSAERFAALISDLDSERFEVREKAQTELIHLGEGAIPLLRKTQTQGRPSLELRRRVEHILEKLEEWHRTPEGLRTLRAIDVLEHSGSASARPMLERLAVGVAESRQTSEAKAALKRLDRQSRYGHRGR